MPLSAVILKSILIPLAAFIQWKCVTLGLQNAPSKSKKDSVQHEGVLAPYFVTFIPFFRAGELLRFYLRLSFLALHTWVALPTMSACFSSGYVFRQQYTNSSWYTYPYTPPQIPTSSNEYAPRPQTPDPLTQPLSTYPR